MCGLVGMAGNIVESDKKALMLLLRFDVVRGWDSTGLGVVTEKDGEIHLHKEVGAPEYLFAIDDNFDQKGIYTGPRGKVFIGHNRAATKGKITKENAHPFLHDGIIGAHNGTLTSVSTLENGYKFDVDSEAIFYNLAQYEAVSVISNVWGAYALTWYDDSDEKLKIIRNVERPLYWTRRTDKDTIFWASEEWMLTYALRKAGVSHGKIEMFEVNTLYTLDVSDCKPTTFRNLDWEKTKDVKGYAPPPPKKQNHVQVGGKKSNVIPFAASSTSSPTSRASKSDRMMMKMLVDSEIQFKFSSVKRGNGTQEYIHAYPANPNLDFEIRIYAQNHVNWDHWKSKMHDTVFKGRIKRAITNYNGDYFLIDLRSIREVLPDVKKDVALDKTEEDFFLPSSNTLSDGDPTIYEGFRGMYITKNEWDWATRKGCANCGDDADEHDADLVFIDHDDFLCGKNGCCDSCAEYIPAGAYK